MGYKSTLDKARYDEATYILLTENPLLLAQERMRKRNSAFRQLYGFIRPPNPGILACQICGKVAPLVPDHIHNTTIIRGWICWKCNYNLGWFEKVQDNLAKYLGK